MSFMVFGSVLTDPDVVANATHSSQQTDYPSSQAYDLDRRKRVWRSGGYFNIIDGENTLVFRETVGVDLTAEITADEYVTDATFLAAVKAALEAAGASTYTVQRDTTTGRIEIVSDGSGGGNIFQLILTDPASADIAGILGFDTASNRTGSLTYEADLLKIHTEEWLQWDLGIPTNPTGFIAVADRNRPLKISPSATIKLQGNWTNNWESPAEDITITYRDFLLAYLAEDGIAASLSNGYRYWRMQIVDQSNPEEYVELGAVMLGLHSVTTRGCPEFPFETEFDDLTLVARSEGGQTIVGRKPRTQIFNLNWRGLDKASFEKLEALFNFYGTHSSFFVAMDPNDAMGTDGETWCRLVKFADRPSGRLESPGNWAMSWRLREEL